MTPPRCPGQDRRFWKPKDIFELQCLSCHTTIEFWKDDPFRYCPGCGELVSNPRVDLSCAKWCQYAAECLGSLPEGQVAAIPVIERLKALLHRRFVDQPQRIKRALNVVTLAETLMESEGGEPHLIKSAALLAGVLLTEEGKVCASPFPDDSPSTAESFWQDMLEQAGLDPSAASQVCAILDAIVSGKTQASPECSVVWNALQFLSTTTD